MGSITVTGLAMGDTGLTITSKTVPSVTTNVPVTVLSRNLLSYWPANASGLACTVNTDGSLHLTGTPTAIWSGVKWRFPAPVTSGTICMSAKKSIPGLSLSMKFYDAQGQKVGDQLTPGKPLTIPDGATQWQLELLCNSTPQPVDADLHVQVETGETATTWMRPDDTSLSVGGGA